MKQFCIKVETKTPNHKTSNVYVQYKKDKKEIAQNVNIKVWWNYK